MLFQDLPSELIVLIVIQCGYQHAARLSCTNSDIRRIVWPEAEKMLDDHRVRFTQAAAAVCRISPEGAASITDPICRAHLDLANQSILDEGAAAIARALHGNRVLKSLNLRGNKIRDEGAAAIGEALRGNGVLTDLNLYNNNIGPEGGVAIGKALAVNGVLTNLNLMHNNIGGVTDYIKASEVEGESKEVGAKVIYEGREMLSLIHI